MTTSTIHPLEQIAAEFDKGESRGPAVMLDLINQYYISKEIATLSHLDEVHIDHAPQGLGTILGFKRYVPKRMQQRLVDLGIFSPNLTDYSTEMQGKIVADIIENMSNGSFYLSDINPNAKDNKRIFATSQQFKDYLLNAGISHLDAATDNQATKSLGNILSFKQENPMAFRQRLAEFGIFSQSLNDYTPEIQEEIIRKILKNAGKGRFKSLYLSDDNTHIEKNRKVIVTSKQMMDYLSSGGIAHLDNVIGSTTTGTLGTLVGGVKRGNVAIFRQKLVELGIFSQNLENYSEEIQDRAIDNIFKNLSTPGFTSFYLSDINPNIEDNRKVVAESQQLKAYLSSQGIRHLDDITSTNTLSSLGSILGGFRQGLSPAFRKRLAELGVFSEDLSDSSYNNLREDISQKLIDNLSTTKPSHYASSDLDETVLQSNREIIIASNAVQRFFADQRYDMNNPDSMNNKVSLFFKKYFGTEEADDVFVISRPKKERQPRYRMIEKEWTSSEEEVLLGEYERAGKDETIFIDVLSENRDMFQEEFGVPYRAIIEKSRYMGLISLDETKGSREKTSPIYAFPSIHGDEFEQELEGFENYARLLDEDITPAATPTFAFTSAAKEEFDAVTVPVWYKGPDPDSYTIAAQRVLSAVQHYLSDNSRFETRENGDIEIDPSTPHEMSPRMLQIEGEHHNLVQLIFRKRFNPDNKIGTTAIDTGNGRDIYVFQHELTPTYDNTRQHKS